MAKYRMVCTGFWENLFVVREMGFEDILFLLYILMNPFTTITRFYRITRKKVVYLKLSIDDMKAILERFIEEDKLFHYDAVNKELAHKIWRRMTVKVAKPCPRGTSYFVCFGSHSKKEVRDLYEL
ncbi:hypothetical protein [Metabacillus niabensis]|uniref:hypothetical protein n=1 Tax=Metabacillus niabensis TaxID=324854 RepID=UPI001CFB028E|nr:hypothetical protein [Metabacillus niabensis]